MRTRRGLRAIKRQKKEIWKNTFHNYRWVGRFTLVVLSMLIFVSVLVVCTSNLFFDDQVVLRIAQNTIDQNIERIVADDHKVFDPSVVVFVRNNNTIVVGYVSTFLLDKYPIVTTKKHESLLLLLAKNWRI